MSSAMNMPSSALGCAREVLRSASATVATGWRVTALAALLLPCAGCAVRLPPTATTPDAQVEPARPSPAPPTEKCPLSTTDYPWPRSEAIYSPLALRFAPPTGFTRVPVPDGGFGQWLRYLPLRAEGTPVRLREGSVVVAADNRNLAAVIDMDVRRNQECADTITRLRAEYLRHVGKPGKIAFRCGGPQKHSWQRWIDGYRPSPEGSGLSFSRVAEPDGSRRSFNAYLDSVFNWCGTCHLAGEGREVASHSIAVGDFLVAGGSPGHAVLIVDLARDRAGHLCALIVQGYMPARSAHVMSPGGADVWFRLVETEPIDTPFWGAFDWSQLRRFD